MSAIERYTQQSIVPSPSATGVRLSRQTARELAAIDQTTEIRSAAIAAAGVTPDGDPDDPIALRDAAMQDVGDGCA